MKNMININDVCKIKTKYKIIERFQITGFWDKGYIIGNILWDNGFITKNRVARINQIV